MVNGAERQRLGNGQVRTELDNVTISQAPDPVPDLIRLSQVLFLVSELEKVY